MMNNVCTERDTDNQRPMKKMNNFYYFHLCLKPIDLEISNFNFSVHSIFSVVAETMHRQPILWAADLSGNGSFKKDEEMCISKSHPIYVL